ncbi:hypothetical protein DFS33DRAFT_126093 [Desarmillaria ectypa]|nr:hypothetical protein DFS33DRAFT_126093 [Desarmillaria ectypa]
MQCVSIVGLINFLPLLPVAVLRTITTSHKLSSQNLYIRDNWRIVLSLRKGPIGYLEWENLRPNSFRWLHIYTIAGTRDRCLKPFKPWSHPL